MISKLFDTSSCIIQGKCGLGTEHSKPREMEWVEPCLEHARGNKRESEVLEEGAYAGTKKEVRRTDSQGLCSPKGL